MFREACPPRQSLGTVQRRSFLGNDLARSRPVGSMYRARHVTSSVFPSRLRRCCAAVGRDRARPPHGRAAASPQCDPPRGGRGCTSAGSATPSTDRSPGSPRRSAGRERNCSGPRTPSCISASGKERPARTPDAILSVTSGHSSRSSADRCRARHRIRLSGARLEKHAKATPMGGDWEIAHVRRNVKPASTAETTSNCAADTDSTFARRSISSMRSLHRGRDVRAGEGERQRANTARPNISPTRAPISRSPSLWRTRAAGPGRNRR